MDKTNILGWEEIMNNNPPVFNKWFKIEKKFLIKNINKHSFVLEVGCGNGRILKEISSITHNLTGIDHDETAVKEATNNLKEIHGAKVILADAKNLPFDDCSFDVVLCMATFANFHEEKYTILAEMRRVLMNRGFMFVSVYSEEALEERLNAYRQANLKIKEIKQDGTVIFDDLGADGFSEQFSKKELEEIFKKAKLKIIEIRKASIAYICKLTK